MTKDEMMNLIDRSLFATLGYLDEQGRPVARRVFCTWHRGLGRHLISTNTSSSHVQRLTRSAAACLYFSDDSSFEGLCLSGSVVVHFERAFRELLWHDGDEKYYPGGIADEDYCVLEFVADAGRYYRFDGKGDVSREELEAYDAGRAFEDGYAKVHAAAAAQKDEGPVILRRFSEEDAPAVSGLIAETMRTSNRRDYAEDYLEEAIRHFQPGDILRRASAQHFYVAEEAGQIVGCGAIGPYWGSEDESILFTIFVRPDRQRRGIGRRIVEALEADEFALRARRIEIPASITGTPFYLKLGYRYKNGVTEPDEERLLRLEKFR